MSIVRIGLSENDKFADGFDAIFGKKDKSTPTKEEDKKKQEEATKLETKEEKK